MLGLVFSAVFSSYLFVDYRDQYKSLNGSVEGWIILIVNYLSIIPLWPGFILVLGLMIPSLDTSLARDIIDKFVIFLNYHVGNVYFLDLD